MKSRHRLGVALAGPTAIASFAQPAFATSSVTMRRLAGDDRYSTAPAIAMGTFEALGASAVQIVGGAADAVSAAVEQELVSRGYASEGNTTTLANLGVALANAGQRVIIVCCDLRRPRGHNFFGLRNDIGFTSVLIGEVDLAGTLQPVPGVDGLERPASGLQPDVSVVLVDSPPVLPVATAGLTTGREARRAIELLRQVGAPLIGSALNGVPGEGGYGRGYGYHKYYARTDAPPVVAPKATS